MSLLDVRGLTCILGNEPLFENLDLTIGSGEAILLKGKNGSGKSTFLKAIAGSRKAEGNVWLEGQRLERLTPAERELRAPLVDQDPLLNWDVTAVDNLIDTVTVGPRILDWMFTFRSTIRRRILEQYGDLLEKFGLADMMYRPAQELSIGQRRLLTLVRALRRRPDGKPRVLLLDEPLAGLQRQRMETVLEALKNRLEEGWAIVVAEHISDIEGLCTRPPLEFPVRQGVSTQPPEPSSNVPPLRLHHRSSSVGGDRIARNSLLSMSGVSAGYGDGQIVRIVEPMAVFEEEITAIVGPNAAGKSTLLRGLFRDESTHASLSGEVRWGNQVVSHLRDRRHVAPDAASWIPQERFGFPGLTVEETLGGALISPSFLGVKAIVRDLFGGLRRSERDRRESVLGLVKRLCEKRQDGKTILQSRWETLSGGERAMASLAIGLVNSPRVVFLDEPGANLDSDAILTLQSILRQYVHVFHAGCVLIEHRLSFIDGLADHVVTLNGQSNPAIARPSELAVPVEIETDQFQDPDAFRSANDLDAMPDGVNS